MTASLESSKLHMTRGNKTRAGNEATSVYFVNVSEPTTPFRAIALAQQANPSTQDPVPLPRATYDTGLDALDADSALVVDSLTAEQRMEGPAGRLKWAVTVNYRPPTLIGTPTDVDIKPDARAPRFWTEQFNVDVPRDWGKNEFDIRWGWLDDDESNINGQTARYPARRRRNQLGPVTNSAGFKYGTVPTARVRYPIFVMKVNTLSPFNWIGIQNRYGPQLQDDHVVTTVNDKTWKIFDVGRRVRKRTCMFLGIETSRPKYWNNVEYFELEARVLYSPTGHDIRVRNEGDKVWESGKDGDGKLKFKVSTPFASGIPIQPPVALNPDGTLGDGKASGRIIRFRDSKGRNYDQLTRFLLTGRKGR